MSGGFAEALTFLEQELLANHPLPGGGVQDVDEVGHRVTLVEYFQGDDLDVFDQLALGLWLELEPPLGEPLLDHALFERRIAADLGRRRGGQQQAPAYRNEAQPAVQIYLDLG